VKNGAKPWTPSPAPNVVGRMTVLAMRRLEQLQAELIELDMGLEEVPWREYLPGGLSD
jgi:hypothetical protein